MRAKKDLTVAAKTFSRMPEYFSKTSRIIVISEYILAVPGKSLFACEI